MVRIAMALLLAGCLSKPDPPAASDGGADGMPSDAPPACTGDMHFDPTFSMERVARMMDFNHDGADDVIVFGRVGASAPFMSHVYVVLGRSPMSFDCYDFDLTPGMAGDLIDVWVGEITGDNVDDLALLVNTGTGYYVELYPGKITGGLMQRTTQSVTYGALSLAADIGGTPGDRSPAFLSAIRWTGGAGLVFGGLYQPWAMAPFTTGALDAVRQLRDGSNSTFGALDSSEQVWAHAAGAVDNELVVATTAGELRILKHESTDVTAARFVLPDAPIQVHVGIDGGNKQRTVRVWHRTWQTDGTIAAAEGAAGIALLGYHTYDGVNGGFSSVHITTNDTDGGYTHVYDYAFGNLDGDRNDPLDVIALTGTTSTARRLSVHPNLVFEPDGQGLIAADPGVAAELSFDNTLAVGDFDSEPGTKDQILVLHSPVGGSIGECYEIVRMTSACIARCGTTTCL